MMKQKVVLANHGKINVLNMSKRSKDATHNDFCVI